MPPKLANVPLPEEREERDARQEQAREDREERAESAKTRTTAEWFGHSYAPLSPRSPAAKTGEKPVVKPVSKPVAKSQPQPPKDSQVPRILTSRKAAPASASIDVLTLIDSPAIFGNWFKPRDSWFPWRVLLAAAYGLPASRTGDERRARELFTECTHRTVWPTERSKIVAVCAGQRSGKSRMSALNGVALSTLVDYSEYLVPGERGRFPIISADRRQAQVALGYAKAFVTGSEIFKQMLVDEGELKEKLVFSNSVDLEVMTGSFRTARGFTNIGGIFDEIAYYLSDDSNANPDHEIVNAVRRGTRTIPTSMLFAISSPYAMSGVLYEWYKKHFGVENASVLYWKAPTWVMNLTITREDLQEEFDEDPDKADADYGANFRKDVAKFVQREVIEACIDRGRVQNAPHQEEGYVGFVDPSGGSVDAMTLGIGHRSDGQVVIDLLEEWLPPFSPDSVVEECCEHLSRFGLTEVTGDRYAGLWPTERFAAHGVVYEPAERSKSQIYRDALPMFNSHRVRLVDNKKLVTQLVNLERRTTRGGQDTIDHPAKGHDDSANSVCGVISELSEDVITDLTF